MTQFLTAHSRALDPADMAEELASAVEAGLSEITALSGVLILATAACGDDCFEVGRRLAERWPKASVLGTSFEGVLAGGQIYRDEPAMVLLAWMEPALSGSAVCPVPFVLDPAEVESAHVAEAIFEAAGRSRLESGDLVLLFADAHASLGFEEMLASLGSKIAPASLAGAGATGIDGREARAFLGSEELPGAMIGLFIPSRSQSPSRSRAGMPLVRAASASRAASPWLEITKCRPRWIDELDGEPALDWVRRQLGIEADSPIEPYLDQLLARVRPAEADSGTSEEGLQYDERYVIGLDDRRGSFSWPGRFSGGDQLALALPDGAWAREVLRDSVGELKASPVLLQFACRARDASLHGDSDLESAWVAHCAGDREVIGTIAPLQFAMSPPDDCRMLVHSTVLAALGFA